MSIHDRKSAILRASEGGLTYFTGCFGCEFLPVRNGKTQNKGKRKVSIKLIDGIWYAKDWTGTYPNGDIFDVCGALHGLETKGSDFIKILEILEGEYHISKAASTRYTTEAKHIKTKEVGVPQPYCPNKAYELRISSSYELDRSGSAIKKRNEVFSQWHISADTLDRYEVWPIGSITKVDTKFKRRSTAYKPLFLFKAGENLKAYCPVRLWKGGTKTLFIQSRGNYVFGYDQLPEKCKGIVLAAGQKDVLALNSLLNDQDIYAICLNSETQTLYEELYRDLKNRADQVYVLYDNDLTGILSSWQMLVNYPGIVRLDMEMAINDVCDYLEAYGPARLKEILDLQIQRFKRRLVPQTGDALREYSGTTLREYSGTTKTQREDFNTEIRGGRGAEVHRGVPRYRSGLRNSNKDYLSLIGLFNRLVSFFPTPTSEILGKLQGNLELIASQGWMSSADGVKAVCAFFDLWLEEKTAKRIRQAIEKTVSLASKIDGEIPGEYCFKFPFSNPQISAPNPPQNTPSNRAEKPLFLDTIELTYRKREKTALYRCIGGFDKNGQTRLFTRSDEAVEPTSTAAPFLPQLTAFDWLKLRQKQNKIEVKNLRRIIQRTVCRNAQEILSKIASKKSTCSFFFMGREIPTGEIFKMGTNLCKHKGCQICSYIVSRERKKNVLAFFRANRTVHDEYKRLTEKGLKDARMDICDKVGITPEDLDKHLLLDTSKYHFYHLGLTLQHDEHNRNGDYSDELIENLKWLRNSARTFFYEDGAEVDRETKLVRTGKDEWKDPDGKKVHKETSNKQFWKNHVDAGFYSMEVIGNQSNNPNDNSLHIHLHVILASEKCLEETDFEQEIRNRWKAKSGGDSDQIKLERVYKLEGEKPEEGMPDMRQKVHYYAGDDPELLDKVLSETCKYTLKMDFETMAGTEGEVLASLLRPGKRYFNFFGSFYGKGINNFDYSDIELVHLSENEIVSPSTGEIFSQGETQISITPLSNVEYTPVNGAPVYSYKDLRKRIFPNTQELPGELGGMSKGVFQERLKKRARAKIKDGQEVEAYKNLLDEMDFTGELFFLDQGEWKVNIGVRKEGSLGNTREPSGVSNILPSDSSPLSPDASGHNWEFPTTKEAADKIIDKRKSIEQLAHLKGVEFFERHEVTRLRKNLEKLEQTTGISRDKLAGASLVPQAELFSPTPLLQTPEVEKMQEIFAQLKKAEYAHDLTLIRMASLEKKTGVLRSDLYNKVLDNPENQKLTMASLKKLWRLRHLKDAYIGEGARAAEVNMGVGNQGSGVRLEWLLTPDSSYLTPQIIREMQALILEGTQGSMRPIKDESKRLKKKGKKRLMDRQEYAPIDPFKLMGADGLTGCERILLNANYLEMKAVMGDAQAVVKGLEDHPDFVPF